MKPLRFHRAAESELIEAALFYEDRRSGLGEQWRTSVESVLRKVRKHPNAGRPAGSEAKQLRISSFPYKIIFLRRMDEVYIIAIAHQRRRPGYWIGRLPDGAS